VFSHTSPKLCLSGWVPIYKAIYILRQKLRVICEEGLVLCKSHFSDQNYWSVDSQGTYFYQGLSKFSWESAEGILEQSEKKEKRVFHCS